ncbi:hypothetical protein [Paenibacillus lutimineralis]|nr:hypothetical protein [Paenibacillus lutimineralis]
MNLKTAETCKSSEMCPSKWTTAQSYMPMYYAGCTWKISGHINPAS